ncbi:hypothetical protein ACFQH2_00700 [Natronoarchaeum sp. GCM10025703]|uniref:hypothetical protein n=1 Tax=unclassified Natronoarchaeum TaxID=2620183 RepID=UPI003611806D
MRPRVKSSLLWGVVGALSFLVLQNGYVLLGGDSVPLWGVATLTALVGVVSAVTTYYGEGWWLSRKENA